MRRSIRVNRALRLARCFGNAPEFWLNLQSTYDLQSASRDRAESIQREVRPRHAA